MTTFDIYLVGVGGQGVLTIGDLITRAAFSIDLPVNYYPTKGMAQRGGFVKAQVRLGRTVTGPHIPEKGADLAIAMERSEALKAVRYLKPGGHFVLYGHVWQPSGVMLGKSPYPSREDVIAQIEAAGGTVHYLDPADVPFLEERRVAANVFVLGAAVGKTPLGDLLEADLVTHLVETRWKRGLEANRLAFTAGLKA